MLGNLGFHMKGKSTSLPFILNKINSKFIEELNLKPKALKLLNSRARNIS